MRNGLIRRLSVGAALVAFLFSSSGCFGGFNLTRNVWQFNRNVSDNKWIQELVFLGLVIVPVYAIASVIDAIFLNSIEFWTGDNPVSVSTSPTTRVVERGDTRIVQTMAAAPDRKTMVLEEYRGDALVKTTTMRQQAGDPSITRETRYPDGRTEVQVTRLEPDGSAMVEQVDDEGRLTTRPIAAAEVERLGAEARRLARTAGTTRVALATRAW